jgi:hypothetical protein
MSFGQGNFKTTSHKTSGAPFAPGSAENGVSVDPVTGRIVLGNNVASLLAQLLSNREIEMNGFFLRLLQGDGDESAGKLIVSSGNITDVNFFAKVQIEGATITKRAVLMTEADITADDPSDCFGIFQLDVAAP